MRIFLSYPSALRPVAERLSLSLRQDGHVVFFDKASLPEGGGYDKRIREELQRAQLLVYLVSPESVAGASYARSELEIFSERFPNPDGRVLPVFAAPTALGTVPNYLRAVTILDPAGDLVAEVTATVATLGRRRRRRLVATIGAVALAGAMTAGLYVRYHRTVPATPSASALPTRVQLVAGLSVFERPDQDSKIVARPAVNSTLELLGKRDENWIAVRVDGKADGFVMAQDLSYVKDAVSTIDVATGYGFRGSFWQLFLTSPQFPRKPNEYGIDVRFADAVGRTRKTLDIAVYELNNRPVIEAILEAHRRGVGVRIATDRRELERVPGAFEELRRSGIPVVTINRAGIMHDKFAVLDRRIVWTGSWNYTDAATYDNNENAIAFDSAQIAAVYASKFDRMFDDAQQGKRPTGGSIGSIASGNSPRRQVAPGVEVYFAPEDNVLGVVQSVLTSARRSIRFMTFAFTAKEPAQALVDLAARGVEVRGILEAKLARARGPDSNLFAGSGRENLELRLDGNPHNLHHDCFVVDDRVVVTGSMNVSYAGAMKNDENMVVVDDAALAARYRAEFDRLWRIAQPYPR